VAVGPQKDLLIRSNDGLSEVRPYIAGLIDGLAARKRYLGTDYEIDYREREPHHLEDKKVKATAFTARSESGHDLIFPMSTTALLAATDVPGSTPIVFPSVSDHKADGMTSRRNATGVSARRSQTAGECFIRFMATVPTLKEVRVLYRPRYKPAERALKLVKAEAKKRKVNVKPTPVASRSDVEERIAAMPKRNPQKPAEIGVLVLPVDICLGAAPRIIELAQGGKNLPTFFPITDCVKSSLPSALGGYGVPQHRCGELAAEHVDRILWGDTKAKTLAVTAAPDDAFDWAISRAAAHALNIPLPRSI
jgi:ABC-type uncharacterized transport system substrate-binding protein